MNHIENMDELIEVVSFRVSNEALTPQVFTLTNQLMYSAIADISDVINKDGAMTVDISTLQMLFGDAGKTIMASAIASGEDRAKIATENVIASLLLEVENITSVRRFLISIMYDDSITLKDIAVALKSVRTAVDKKTIIMLCTAVNKSMDKGIRVTLFAISFDTSFECDAVI